MVLVDTSIWISHFIKGNTHLKELLNDESVACHPFIIGELACGGLKNRKEILSLLKALPQVQTAESDEILQFIDSKRLFGTGLGLVDVHLLASALLTKMLLWTADKSLQTAADKLNILHDKKKAEFEA
ncbi:MAG: PIN domain-containing protein [Candidatus Scalindua sp.]